MTLVQKIMTIVAVAMASLFVNPAIAQTIATAPTTKGGEIRLMKNKGKCSQDMTMVIVTTPGGDFLSGCWMLLENKVFADFEAFQKLYDPKEFTLVNQPAKSKGIDL